MAQKSGEIWTGPRLLQPDRLKSDRLLVGLRLDQEQEYEGADLAIHKISATPPTQR